ncbi:MAG: hypothetical protein NVS3B1_06380 [Marmoricola sp.]
MSTVDILLDHIAKGGLLHELTGFRSSLVDHRDRLMRADAAAPPPPASYSTPHLADLPTFDQGTIPKCVATSISLCKTAMGDDETGVITLFDDDEFYSHIADPNGGGADIRTALDWVLHTGLKVKADGTLRQINGYAGIVPTDHVAVMTALAGGGILEVGFDVPRSFMQGGGHEFKVQPGVDPQNNTADPIVGGHGIAVVRYDPAGPWFKNSWGADWPVPGARGLIQVSWDFWDTYVTECWALGDAVPA